MWTTILAGIALLGLGAYLTWRRREARKPKTLADRLWASLFARAQAGERRLKA